MAVIQQLGPYQIRRVIGRGGMGTVYVGVDQASGQRAAIKVLSPALAADAGFRTRFKTEIETLLKLKHPNIVKLYGFGEDHEHVFFSMEFVDGPSLQEELTRGSRPSWPEVVSIGIDVCQALKHAHDLGVVHRDLKPANLLVDREGQVKLTDFGIAKLFGQTQLTADGGVLGTADYMSPEQADGRQATPRSDLYSLGSVLYALLAGRPPFCGKSIPEVVHKLRFEAPRPIQHLVPDVPVELADLLHQLLQKDPRDRVATALALSYRLEGILSATPEARDGPALTDKQPGRVARDVLPISDFDSTRVHGVAELSEEAGAVPAESAASSRPAPLGDSASGPDSRRYDDVGPPTKLGADPPDVRDDSTVSAETSKEAVSRFTKVDEQQRQRAFQLAKVEEPREKTLQKMALPVVTVLVVLIGAWYVSREPTADQLYSRIVAVADGEDASDMLKAEDDIQQFLARFPDDPRHAEVSAWMAQVELRQLRRRIERYARRSGNDAALSPVEQQYLSAMRTAESDPEAAAARLQALVDLFGSEPEAPKAVLQCVELARQELRRLRVIIDRDSQAHRAVLKERLRRADQLRESDPAAAIDIWRGIVRLYENKPWAAEMVQEARRQLSATQGS